MGVVKPRRNRSRLPTGQCWTYTPLYSIGKKVRSCATLKYCSRSPIFCMWYCLRICKRGCPRERNISNFFVSGPLCRSLRAPPTERPSETQYESPTGPPHKGPAGARCTKVRPRPSEGLGPHSSFYFVFHYFGGPYPIFDFLVGPPGLPRLLALGGLGGGSGPPGPPRISSPVQRG